MPRFSVVVPVFNEAELIGATLERMRELLPPDHEVLLCYDHEDDTTLPAARALPEDRRPEGLRFVRNELGPGPRFAIEAGMRAAESPVVFVAMADLSDDLEQCGEMLERAEAGADVVCASRYMPGGEQIGGPWLKGQLSRWAGLSLYWLTGLATRDPTNSFKAYRRDFLERTRIETEAGFALGIELTVKAHFGGGRVEEVPARWWDRSAGESRFRLLRWLPGYLRWYFFAFRARAAAALRSGGLACVLALLVAGVAQLPILGHSFFADDFRHLYDLAVRPVGEFLLLPHGGHLLSSWRLVFWVFEASFGLEARLWFLATWLTHLANVALVYATARQLGTSAPVAGTLGALWGASFLARGSLAWISVYPHVLATTFVLLAIHDVLRVANGRAGEPVRAGLRWMLLLLLAANSFGVAIGVAVFFPFACWLLLSGSGRRARAVALLCTLWLLVPLNYALVASQASDAMPTLEATGPVQWSHVLFVLDLAARLTGYGVATAVTGPLLALTPGPAIRVADGLLAGTPIQDATPWIFTVAILVGLAILWLLLRADARARRSALALLLLLLATYLPIAHGRSWNTAADAALWSRARYHYLAPALFWLALAPLLPRSAAFGPTARRAVATALALFVALSAWWSYQMPLDAVLTADMEESRQHLSRTRTRIDRRIDRTRPGGTAWLRNRSYELGLPHPFPGWAAIFTIVYPENRVRGREVRFVEPDPERREWIYRGGGERMRELIVAPEEVPEADRKPRKRRRGAETERTGDTR